MLHIDMEAARSKWVESFPAGQDRIEADESDFLQVTNSEGEKLDFHSLRHTTASWLIGAGVDPKTVQTVMRHADIRTCGRYVKAMFTYAFEHEWLPRNPFAKLKSSPLAATRAHYVTPEQTELIFKAIDSYFGADSSEAIQWRLLVALARYAGLRTPSETHAITWRAVDWANNALVVQVRKTRRYAATRTVPIIPELLPILQAGFDRAPVGASTVLTLSAHNLHRKLSAI